MNILLQQSNINYPRLKKTIYEITAEELSNLTEPCYYPSLKKYYFEFMYLCGIKEKDIKDFVKRFYRGTPEAKWKLQVDPKTNFYMFIMHALLLKNEISAYRSMLAFFVIRNYTNLIYKQIQFCNKDVFKYTLEHLAKTHLFSREKTIPGAIFYISKEMEKKHTSGLKSPNVPATSKFITECRTRISQSIKSFAEMYYKASKEGSSIREPYEDEDSEHQYQQLEKTSRVINDIVKNITVYRIIDQKAINEARTLTKIRMSLSVMISEGLRDVKYADNIRIILELFAKSITSVDNLCGKEYYNYVRSLMAIKRTKSMIYFKQQINVLLLGVIKDLNSTKQYNSLTKQTQSLVNLYLAYYITMCMKNSVC